MAQEQEGVLARTQLCEHLVPGVFEAQVNAGRCRRLSSTVYVTHNGPLTEKQQWWAAALAVGPLAGRTALRAWGLKGWPSQHVEVVVPRGAHPELPSEVPIQVHESRRLTEAALQRWRSPQRTNVERSAIDAAAWTKDARAACGLLAAVVQQRMSVAPKLRRALAEAGRVRHVTLLRSVLNDIEGGAQALSEVDLGRVCRRYGLVLERQVIRLDQQGRRRYVDARVSAPGGHWVLVEVDGALHLVVSSYWADMERGNEMVISGGRVLRFPSIALRVDEQTVGNQLRRACGLAELGRSEAA
ncbi:MAG: hypothetical protein JWN31_173 [Frankiales bacterium]|nr:hypothetical protein [Frankiales bacterium]